MAEQVNTVTPEHQRVMDEDHDRRVEAALQEGLKMRALCERVLSPGHEVTLADLERDEAALMHGGGSCEVCSCAAARRVIDALNAERREGRREVERERDEARAEVARLRALVQSKLDEIVVGLDACSWGDDEAWQIQCHMDCLVDIINAAGGTAERVAFVVDPVEGGAHG